MAAFKKRTRAERRNRARNKLVKKVAWMGGGFGMGRNMLRHRYRRSHQHWFRHMIGDTYTNQIIGLIDQLRSM